VGPASCQGEFTQRGRELSVVLGMLREGLRKSCSQKLIQRFAWPTRKGAFTVVKVALFGRGLGPEIGPRCDQP
jgi:hypothetical protein